MEENRIVMELENSDTPEEAAAARQQSEQFHRNSAWLEEHILEIGESYRGKVIRASKGFRKRCGMAGRRFFGRYGRGQNCNQCQRSGRVGVFIRSAR
jgi:hypothetical protein